MSKLKKTIKYLKNKGWKNLAKLLDTSTKK